MRKVLVANRGEIAVRVIRACRDAGLRSVAVYAEPDRDAPHVRMADEAFALGGDRPATSYLDIAKLLDAASVTGADAVHPGYGFLSEDAAFAQTVVDAGLTWIGPPARVIRALGDKVAARHIARRAGAPLVDGTPGPVSGPDEVVAFACEFGLPVAIKASFGGGGRGLKVARSLEEIPELYESAVREAVAAFGHGECFAERYLDRPRHVETQCLADAHGNVIVVSTRDCSLQRRHQKLVEEAPAPFLTAEQNAQLYAASKSILVEAGYVGAGTCEFLVSADGEIFFLEVNTRLQVEHPVTEEVTDIDLVREQFRIAEGECLDYADPVARRHSFEFRINCEDPGRGFLPAPGTVATFTPPAGPGVRVDSGVESGTVIGPAWDSLLAKLVVTGADRAQALQRAARALAEFTIDGIATVLPFHRAVVADPAFVSETFDVHTRWIETDFVNAIPAHDAQAGWSTTAGAVEWETVFAEVGGKRVAISLPSTFAARARPAALATSRSVRNGVRKAAASGDGVVTPMQGTIVKVAVAEGQAVVAGELIAVLEAMKMEQPLNAHKSGTVVGLRAEIGQTVASGTALCHILAAPGSPPAVERAPRCGTAPAMRQANLEEENACTPR